MDDLSMLCGRVGVDMDNLSPGSKTPSRRNTMDLSERSVRRSPRLLEKKATKTRPKPPIRRKASYGSSVKASRSVLSKRKFTMFKKAQELHRISGVEVLVLVKVNKKRGTGSKLYYGGSSDLVTEFETSGISRGKDHSELYKRFDGPNPEDNSDEEDLVTGPLSHDEANEHVPEFMETCLGHGSPSGPAFIEPVSEASISTCPSIEPLPIEPVSEEPASTGSLSDSPQFSSLVFPVHTPSPITKTPKAKRCLETEPSYMYSTQASDTCEENPLTEGMWVAIAYYRTFHIGKIIEIGERLTVKFLVKKCSHFCWPRVDEIENVLPIYLFSRNCQMEFTKGKALRFTCNNLSEIQKSYAAFKSKNRNIL